jgi:S-DNA-T family DNA segregation ATPase FtsK/SpoIIIE
MSLDTRGNDPQRLLPQSVEDRLLSLVGLMSGLVLLVVLACVWASLATWSINDPSLTHATTAEARNIMGPLGAVVSDLLLQTFGLTAVLALLPPMLWAIDLVAKGQVPLGRSKLGYYPIAALLLAGALSSYPVFGSWPLNHGMGGAIGDGLFTLASNLFKLINKDRADLAAGLLLNVCTFAVFAKSTGFDAEAYVTSLWARRDEFASRGENLSEAGTRWLEKWSRKSKAAAAPAGVSPAMAELMAGGPQGYAHAPGYGAAYASAPAVMAPEPMAYAPAQPAPAWGHDGYTPMAQALDRLATIAEKQEAHLAHLLARNHGAEAAAAPGTNAALADEFRGFGFDVSTDSTSHAIAARFAPAITASDDDAEDDMLGAAPAVAPAPVRPLAKLPAMLRHAQAAKAAALAAAQAAVPAPAATSAPSNATAAAPAAPQRTRQWKRPSLNLLKRAPAAKPGPELTQTVMRGNARLLEDVLADFGVKGEVKDIHPGPVVTLYELEPARGTKSSRVIGLADDIARSMSVVSVRAAVVPGRNAIGLELPNMRREPVLLREMLEAEAYRTSDAALPITLGKSIGGEPIVADLARMPHLLVAGTTGSGKSVGVNAFIISLLYRHSPNECRFLMIDPKMLELSVYNGIPHLLTPVVTDPHKAVHALNWAVREMEERYKRMATLSVRNIDVFNNRVRNAQKRGEMISRTVQTGFDRNGQAIIEKQNMNLEPMPHIVIVVDEFADLMVVAGKEVEGAVQRLAQMARAAGIHLIMATQRPSVDVITGTIKANFPTRISFKVTSKIDSRTILNEQGAEQLLGQGDMLYSSGSGQIVRVHGAFVADEEVEAIAQALREQGGPQYVDGLLDASDDGAEGGAAGEREMSDGDLYDRAVAIVLRDRKASTSYLQRRLSIGYNRAADLIERMEREGVISPASPTGKRDILSGPGGSVDAA